MPKSLTSSKKLEREREVASELYGMVFPNTEVKLAEDKAFFALKVGEFYYKVEIKETGKKWQT